MAFPLAILFVVVYFGFHAFHGKNGFQARVTLEQDIASLEEKYQAIHEKRTNIQKHVDLLSPEHVDPDFLEEMVRRQLGYSHPDDIILPN